MERKTAIRIVKVEDEMNVELLGVVSEVSSSPPSSVVPVLAMVVSCISSGVVLLVGPLVVVVVVVVGAVEVEVLEVEVELELVEVVIVVVVVVVVTWT